MFWCLSIIELHVSFHHINIQSSCLEVLRNLMSVPAPEYPQVSIFGNSTLRTVGLYNASVFIHFHYAA